MRWVSLALVLVGCAAGVKSKYSALIDEPFIRDEQPPPSTTHSASAGGGIAAGPLAASAQVSIEVPRIPLFFGVELKEASELVFVLDRSGSMLGRKLDEAKAELARTLDTLPDGTRFNIVFFGDRVTPLSSDPLTLTPDARQQTRKFLARIHVEDSTAMVPALWLADQMRSKRVILLTDGEANVMGGPDEVLASGRAMIKKGVRFDVVVLLKLQARCADRFPGKGMSVSTAAIEEACRAEKAAATVRTLASESGGTYREPFAEPQY